MTMPMRDRSGDGVTTGEYTDIIDVCRDWSAALCGRLATVGNDRRARVVTGVCEPGVSLCDAAAVDGPPLKCETGRGGSSCVL